MSFKALFSRSLGADPERLHFAAHSHHLWPDASFAGQVAACGPLGIQTTLVSAHLAIDAAEEAAFSKLGAQYGALYRTHDFVERLTAQAEGRAPVFRGN